MKLLGWLTDFFFEPLVEVDSFSPEGQMADWDRRFKAWLVTQPSHIREDFDREYALAKRMSEVLSQTGITLGVPGFGRARLG